MIRQNMTLGELLDLLQEMEKEHGRSTLVYAQQEGHLPTRILSVKRLPHGIYQREEYPDRIVIEADSESYL